MKLDLDINSRESVDVDSVIKKIKTDPLKLVRSYENRFDGNIDAIAKAISENIENIRVMMISGPSSSGKTTTSLKLVNALNKYNIKAVNISLDNYYLGIEYAPKTPEGNPDFETIHALDLPLINSTLSELIDGGKTELPMFNFMIKKREREKKPVSIDGKSIAIIEGIHALNPLITADLPENAILKTYISVKDDFYKGNEIFLSKRQLRLTRRIIRDHNYRSTDASATLAMWSDVCKGEDIYIKPFQTKADIILNSAASFEPGLYLPFVRPLLEGVDATDRNYAVAAELLEKLSAFPPVDDALLEKDCLLREFIGGSSLVYA